MSVNGVRRHFGPSTSPCGWHSFIHRGAIRPSACDWRTDGCDQPRSSSNNNGEATPSIAHMLLRPSDHCSPAVEQWSATSRPRDESSAQPVRRVESEGKETKGPARRRDALHSRCRHRGARSRSHSRNRHAHREEQRRAARSPTPMRLLWAGPALRSPIGVRRFRCDARWLAGGARAAHT